jgi:mRNA-degrading endonuclease HigB of HigAB toxin-antitoxin module
MALLSCEMAFELDSYKTIREFSDKHADAADALNNWYIVVEKGDFVRTVYILFVGTHAEYNKIDAPKIKFKKQ